VTPASASPFVADLIVWRRAALVADFALAFALRADDEFFLIAGGNLAGVAIWADHPPSGSHKITYPKLKVRAK
jgi:hypothetical protein